MEMFDMFNQMNTKDLVNCCKAQKVQQSIDGVKNKYTQRKNLIAHHLERSLTTAEMRMVDWGGKLRSIDGGWQRYIPVSER